MNDLYVCFFLSLFFLFQNSSEVSSDWSAYQLKHQWMSMQVDLEGLCQLWADGLMFFSSSSNEQGHLEAVTLLIKKHRCSSLLLKLKGWAWDGCQKLKKKKRSYDLWNTPVAELPPTPPTQWSWCYRPTEWEPENVRRNRDVRKDSDSDGTLLLEGLLGSEISSCSLDFNNVVRWNNMAEESGTWLSLPVCLLLQRWCKWRTRREVCGGRFLCSQLLPRCLCPQVCFVTFFFCFLSFFLSAVCGTLSFLAPPTSVPPLYSVFLPSWLCVSLLPSLFSSSLLAAVPKWAGRARQTEQRVI